MRARGWECAPGGGRLLAIGLCFAASAFAASGCEALNEPATQVAVQRREQKAQDDALARLRAAYEARYQEYRATLSAADVGEEDRRAELASPAEALR